MQKKKKNQKSSIPNYYNEHRAVYLQRDAIYIKNTLYKNTGPFKAAFNNSSALDIDVTEFNMLFKSTRLLKSSRVSSELRSIITQNSGATNAL